MSQIHRKDCPLGVSFSAPQAVTFGYQSARGGFSVWYREDEPATAEYMIVGTGHEFDDSFRLVASHVMSDGYHVFHLLKKEDL